VDDRVISVEGASKKFCRDLRRSLAYAVADIARDLFGGRRAPATLRQDEFWALRGVSLEVRRGESVALMGVNGAGKSTLLNLMLGSLRLTEGRTAVAGRLAALSEHGLGLDPMLTGRENAYLIAAVLGVAPRRVDEAFDEIVAFAGLPAFIDAPVRSYSSGMRARLGFSVAMHLEPDAVLVDEVLTVGDLGFQRRCIDHTKRYLARGGVLILVSHNPHLVQSLCRRCVVLDRGAVVFDGEVVEGVARYFDAVQAAGPEVSAPPAGLESGSDGGVVVEDFGIQPLGAGGLCTGGAARVYVRYRSRDDLRVRWAFSILTADLETTIACEGPLGSFVLPAGDGELSGTVPRLPLSGGRYALRVVIMDPHTELPFSMRGFRGAPCYFEVGMATSLRNNYRMFTNDLVALEDLVWDDRSRGASG
jgi:ABC-type polysaccharide/polyol phosphate transport system ATPase subunit